MKTKFTLLMLLSAFVFAANAQSVPNGNLETWDDDYTPTGWATFDAIIPPLAGSGLSLKDTADKAQGTASIKLTSTYVSLAQDTIPGAVSIGSGAFNGQVPTFYGVPFTFKPDTLWFAYKYAPSGLDTAGVQLLLSNAGAPGFALGVFFPLESSANWVNIFAPLAQYYQGSSAVDTLQLQFFSSSGNVVRNGSTLNVDAIRFGYVNTPSFVEDIRNDIKVSLFPNPAKDNLNIQLSEAISNASVMVFDLNGRVVTHEFMSGPSHQFNVGSWGEGVYSYAIFDGSTAVVKGRFSVSK